MFDFPSQHRNINCCKKFFPFIILRRRAMQPQNNPPILQVNNLYKSYGNKPIVNGLSFEVGKGEVVGLLGPNGAGKTTAFYMTIGLIRPDAGEVLFKQASITQLPIHERAKMGLGYLAQEPSVFRDLTVEENLLCILETLSLSKEEIARRLQILLHE